MGETKFTPGPWQLVDNTHLVEGEIWIEAEHAEIGPVSLAAVRAGCDEAAELGSNMANARLIAAAPEMFEALKSLCEELMLEDPREPEDALGASMAEKYRKALAAISKATGETP